MKLLLSFQLFVDVVCALEEAAKDPDTKITATTGAGTVFCAGNDLKNFHNLPMKQIEQILIRFVLWMQVCVAN